jgi:hypothetical protein
MYFESQKTTKMELVGLYLGHPVTGRNKYRDRVLEVGVGRKADDFASYKFIVAKCKDVKTGWSSSVVLKLCATAAR